MSTDTFMLWRPDMGETWEDARPISGLCVQYAIQDWAQRDDARSADYSIASGVPERVFIIDGEKDVEFIVSGESQPVYYARLVTKKEPT